jgi:hypothetical protein
MASSQNFFVWFCRVLICQRGLIPTEQNPTGYQTPQNKTLRGIRPHRTKSCGVSDPAEQWQSCEHFIAYACSAGSDTPQNNVRWGLIPRLTKSCQVSDPAEQSPAGYQTPRNNIENQIFCEFEKEFKNILGCEFGDYMGSIRGKNQRSKISCYCPF